jgi:hypothetical protein
MAALDGVGRGFAPVRLRLTGVTLTAGGVMVQAEPVGDAPWELMRRLRAALGPLAWYEDQWQERDIWYASIVHFAGPLLDAAGLVEWARERRTSLSHDLVLDALTLTRFRYVEDGVRRRMAMEPWHRVELSSHVRDT